MTDKELRRLSRVELLQLLMEQTKENERLRSKIMKLTELADRYTITCLDAGSIAEAALRLNGVFQAADQAAQQYVREVAIRTSHQNEELEKKAIQAQVEADALVKQAQERADMIMEEAKLYAEKQREEADTYLTAARLHAEKVQEKAKREEAGCDSETDKESENVWNKENKQNQIHWQSQKSWKKWFFPVGRDENA